MSRLTPAEIESQVSADYHAVAGKVVLLSEVECYDDSDNSVTVTCDPPAIARISRYQDRPSLRENVCRWTDDSHCDPYWNIEILEPHPAFANVRPSWVYGTCRSTDGTVEPAAVAVADAVLQARYATAPALPYETGAAAPHP